MTSLARATVALTAITCLLSPPAAAQDRHDARFDALVALAEAKMREYHVPGVAIGIIDNGIVTTRGLGVTNVEDALPVTAHTVFPIASISKTFAATSRCGTCSRTPVGGKARSRDLNAVKTPCVTS